MNNPNFERALDAHFDRKYDEQCDALDERGGEEGIEIDCEPSDGIYNEDWY